MGKWLRLFFYMLIKEVLANYCLQISIKKAVPVPHKIEMGTGKFSPKKLQIVAIIVCVLPLGVTN